MHKKDMFGNIRTLYLEKKMGVLSVDLLSQKTYYAFRSTSKFFKIRISILRISVLVTLKGKPTLLVPTKKYEIWCQNIDSFVSYFS